MQLQTIQGGTVSVYFLLLTIGFAVSACGSKERIASIHYEAAVSIPQMPFDLQSAVYINQYTKPSDRTASWLLGDSVFINQTLTRFFESGNEGRLCVLHWSQINDPAWIGARIPGECLGADLLMYENNELVVRRYTPTGEARLADEDYRKELLELLNQVEFVRYP